MKPRIVTHCFRFGLFLLCGSLFSTPVSASSTKDTAKVPPTVTFMGTRGLTQVSSAEALGAGRMTFVLMESWYQQKTGFDGAPNTGANIGTGSLAFSFAANNYIEIFGSIAGFGISKYAYNHGSGIGSICAGVQGIAPLPARSPFHLGVQAVIIGGTSANQINTNNADGYNYFETRTGYDIVGRAMESIVLGNDEFGFVLMLNQAFSTSVQQSQSNLMMLSGGMQGIFARYYCIGLELNSRTYFHDIRFSTDPFWLTPSVTIRGPFYLGLTVGVDISLSRERSNDPAPEALEPFRLFGATTLSFDALARKRRREREERQRESQEKDSLTTQTKALREQMTGLEEKARQDSLENVRRADSLAQVSLQLAQKAQADSIALTKKLEEERSKRSDMEKQLLSTGMLVLDAVYFESGKTEISLNSRPYLTIIAKMLAKYPKLKLEVGGHTDSQGSLSLNMRLSQQRAEAVRLFLISVEPNLSGRLTATGYGPSMPKAENTTARGRQINRRVELTVVNKDVLKEYNP